MCLWFYQISATFMISVTNVIFGGKLQEACLLKTWKQWDSGAWEFKGKRKGLVVCFQISSDKFQQVKTVRTLQFHIGSWVKPVLLSLTRLILLPGGGFLWLFCQQSQDACLPRLYRAQLEWGEELLYDNSPTKLALFPKILPNKS